MAVTPINPTFLQKSKRLNLERLKKNFRLQTGLPVFTEALTAGAREQLAIEQQEAGRRAAEAFQQRRHEETLAEQKRQFNVRTKEAEEAREAQEQSFFGQIKKAFS